MSDENKVEVMNYELPKELRRFNWGAFFLTWIWGIFNKSYITLVYLVLSFFRWYYRFSILFILIIFVQFGLAIYFGIKGNKWAYTNKKWKDIESFNKKQKTWAICGLFSIFINIIIILGLSLIPMVDVPTPKKRACNEYTGIYWALNFVVDFNCSSSEYLTSTGLAKYYNNNLGEGTVNENELILDSGSKLIFNGDGKCKDENSCTVRIKLPERLEKYDKNIVLRIYVDDNGYIKVNEKDLSRLESLKPEDF